MHCLISELFNSDGKREHPTIGGRNTELTLNANNFVGNSFKYSVLSGVGLVT